MKAIILAGGFGTRLRPVIGEIPKSMARYLGRPFIKHVVNVMHNQGITDITLALHYKAEMIMEYLGDKYKYKIENEPLGTGGAIKNCISGDEPVLVVNGDTIHSVDYNDMFKKHMDPLTIAVTENGESAGVYIMNPEILDNYNDAFSFEKDVIPHTPFYTYLVPFFTDIGTPESYEKICKDWV